MRRLLVLSFLFLTAANAEKKKKGAEPAPAPEPAPVVEPAPEPEPEPEPAAPEPAPVVSNISLKATIAWGSGTTKAGHITGVERSVDFNGYEGWTTDARKLKLAVEASGTEREVAWTDVKTITITPGRIADEVDCTSNSNMDPVMYECTLRTTATITMKDGSKGVVTNRHMWRFTWEDGSTTELQVYKYTVRAADTYVKIRDQEDTSDPYAPLQERLLADVKAGLLKTITVE